MQLGDERESENVEDRRGSGGFGGGGGGGIGIVGGGGIGATLNTAFDRYEFDSAAAILLVIIGIVMVVEYSSGYLRRWVQ